MGRSQGDHSEMGKLLVVALWVAIICVATGEVGATHESGPPSLAPRHKLAAASWKDLSAEDKRMAAAQAGHAKHSASLRFAQRQSSEHGVFALQDAEWNQAAEQAKRPVFDERVQREVHYLSSPEHESAAHSWQNTINSANQKDREARLKMAELRSGELDLGEAGDVAQHLSLSEGLNQLADALLTGQRDLGESDDVSAMTQNNEKIQKAEEKARLEMKSITEAHLARINTAKKLMQERIRKSNDMRLESDRRSRALVPQAEQLALEQANAQKRAAERRQKASEDQAAQKLERVEASILREQQQDSLDAEAAESKAQNTADQEDMQQKQRYLAKLAGADKKKVAQIAKARQQAQESSLKYKEHARQAKDKVQFKSEAMEKKFETMRSELLKKSNKMISNLQALEQKATGGAEAVYQSAEKSEKQAIRSAGSAKEAAQERAKEKGYKADETDKQAAKDLGESHKMKDQLSSTERKAKRDGRTTLRQLERSQSAQKKSIREQIQATEAEAASKEKKMMQTGNNTDTAYRAKQMRWLDRAKKSAMQNCEDAKKESIFKTKASSLSISSLARTIQDHKTVSSNAVEDSQAKTLKLELAKKAASKTLQKAVAKAASSMATGAKAQLDALKKAAVLFASSKLPADREMKKLENARKESTKANKVALARGSEWASHESTTAAHKFKEQADQTCDQQQQWFAQVRHRVKKRLGTASEKDRKAAEHGEFVEQRWALGKVKILLTKEKTISEQSVKAEIKAGSSEKAKTAFESKAQKTSIAATKERALKLKQQAVAMRTTSKFELKEAIDGEDAKILEARKLREMSERGSKTQEKSARAKEKDQKSAISAKRQQSLHKLKEREEKAVKLLQLKQDDRQERLHKVKKKKKVLEHDARRREEDEVEAARASAAEKTRRAHTEAQRKVQQLKQDLNEAKNAADKRLLSAKLEMAEERAAAKRTMAEALKAFGPDAKKKMILAAKAQAEKLLKSAKKRSVQLSADAKKEFEDTVQRETAKSLKDVKGIKEKLGATIHSLEIE